MIVDDERALVALAEESIAQLGYEPVGFDSSVAALTRLSGRSRSFRCGGYGRVDARS